MFRVCAEAARVLGAEGMQKALAKRVRCITSTQSSTNGQQLADREETELVWPLPFNFPAGVYMYGEMAGVLRMPKQRQAQVGGGTGE